MLSSPYVIKLLMFKTIAKLLDQTNKWYNIWIWLFRFPSSNPGNINDGLCIYLSCTCIKVQLIACFTISFYSVNGQTYILASVQGGIFVILQ